jgi:hypothetical protein
MTRFPRPFSLFCRLRELAAYTRRVPMKMLLTLREILGAVVEVVEVAEVVEVVEVVEVEVSVVSSCLHPNAFA